MPSSPFPPTTASLLSRSPPATASATTRKGKCEDFTFKTDYVGKIGWGVTNDKFMVKTRHVINEKPHEWAFNDGGLRANFQMETTGLHSEKVDTWLGIPNDLID
jgi:hypothetical protein